MAPAVFIYANCWVTENFTVARSFSGIIGNILGETEHVVNLTFISDGSEKNVVVSTAFAHVTILCAKGLDKLRGILNNMSDLSHDSLVEVNLIHLHVESVGHACWGTKHTKDTVEVLLLDWILVGMILVIIDISLLELSKSHVFLLFDLSKFSLGGIFCLNLRKSEHAKWVGHVFVHQFSTSGIRGSDKGNKGGEFHGEACFVLINYNSA